MFLSTPIRADLPQMTADFSAQSTLINASNLRQAASKNRVAREA